MDAKDSRSIMMSLKPNILFFFADQQRWDTCGCYGQPLNITPNLVDATLILKFAQECGAKPYSKEWHKYTMKQLNSPEYRKLNPNRIKL